MKPNRAVVAAFVFRWLMLLVGAAIGCYCDAAPASANEGSLTQVYLVQTSGWMEPFYADKGSEFRQILVSMIDSTQLAGIDVVLATFNQEGQIPGQHSPEVVFQGAYDKSAVADKVDSIAPPRRPDGKYADSDFFGAIKGTVLDVLQGHQGIIWMITNNKDSPNNSSEVREHTAAFYDYLRKSAPITKIVAFPIRMAVHGPHYDEKGFIIYGIAYGKLAARALDFLVGQDKPVRRLFVQPPVRIKPLNVDPLRLELTEQSRGNIAASLEDGILTVRHVPGGSGAELVFSGNLINTYYPQQIDTAKLSVTAVPAGGSVPFEAKIIPASISHLPPGAALKGVSIAVKFSPHARSSIFQDHAIADGFLVIKLSDAALVLGSDFIERMNSVFGVDLLAKEQATVSPGSLPEIMFDYQKVSSATTMIPVRLVYDYSPWPLLLASGGGLVLLAVLGGLGILLVMPRRYAVRVGGSTVQVRLRPFEARVLQGASGIRARVRGALFGTPTVEELSDHEASEGPKGEPRSRAN